MEESYKESVKTIFESCDKECEQKRRYLAPFWKRAEYYWNNIHDIFWDAVSWDWRTFENQNEDEGFQELLDSNKTISTYRAYGESIVSAATIGNLSIRFFPENADDPNDIDKSRIYSDLGDYIQRMNNIKDLRRKAFVIRWNQGLVGIYTYFKQDKNLYGVRKKPKIEINNIINVDKNCSDCGYNESKQLIEPEEMIEDSVGEGVCPQCGSPNIYSNDEVETHPKINGEEEEEKGMAVLEMYPPLSLKVPHYAAHPSQVNYVILVTEMHFSEAIALYPEHAEFIKPGDIDSVESVERSQADYYNDALAQTNQVTIQRHWVKPCMYNIVNKEKAEGLKAEYPDGYEAIFVGKSNILLECRPSKMDDCWTFLKSPTDTHIYCKALGDAMIPIQDIEDDLVYLTMDTIRHSIGETFIDSSLLNLKKYGQQMTKPGSLTPVNPKNRPIGDYFFTTKNASLSREVSELASYIQEKGQLVVGAFPSIYGGQFETGSKTLGVYQESRSQALQRVAIPADGIDDMIAEAIFKAVKIYEKNMTSDESYSVEEGNGFKNVLLRKPLGGNVDRVEVVKSDQFPTTWEQKRGFIMELLGMNLDPINAAIFAAENIGMMSKIVGIPELKIPGEADRNKQLSEIQELLSSTPITEPQMDPNLPPNVMPSVMPDADVDNHSIHIGVAIAWAISPEGIRAKKQNPEGWENVIAHIKAHRMLEMAVQQPVSEPVQEEGVENGVS